MAGYQQGVPIEISDTFTVGGVETDPTTVTYTILGPDGVTTVYVFGVDAEVSNPAIGEYLLSLAPPALPGEYQYDVDATGAVVASRAGSFTVLANVAIPVDLDWAVVGPCTPWASAQDVWECCGSPMTTVGEGSSAIECPVDMSQFAAEASQLLYELSGRQYAGACERTVRPCGRRACGFQVLSRGHIVEDPYWSGSNWFWNDRNGCGCTPLDRILLSGYPVREITEVRIDGVVVDPTTYRLDGRRWLVRVRDPVVPGTMLFWPSCQAMDLPDTETGTFAADYRYGQDPPLAGSAAAAELGCELYKACGGIACALPNGTTRITRQGIVIEKLAFSTWANQNGVWRTGLPLTDAFLSAYSRHGVLRRPVFTGPRSRYARSVGQ